MKQTNSLLRIGLVGLFLTFTTFVLAQTHPTPAYTVPVAQTAGLQVGTLNNGESTVSPLGAETGAVLFYKTPASGGTGITLQASLTGEGTTTEFDNYAWHVVDSDGDIGAPIVGEVARELVLTNLAPGYHRYRVYGFVTSGDEFCQNTDYQDIIFFVLNPLDPSAGLVSPTTAITEFCEGETPTETLDLTATVTFAESYGADNPAVSEMNKVFTWYALYDDGTSTPTRIELGNSGAIAGVTHTEEVSLSLVEAIGTYTFFVEVKYSDDIKAPGGRAHAIWTEQIMTDATNPFVLTVTEKPGRATITIIAHDDN